MSHICSLATVHPLKGILQTLCWDPLRDQHVNVYPYASIIHPLGPPNASLCAVRVIHMQVVMITQALSLVDW